MKHRYTEEQLRSTISESSSLREVLTKLGIVAAGGNYFTLKKRIGKLEIDTKHFTGQANRRGKRFEKKPLQFYLVNEKRIGSDHLRRRLLEEGVFEHCCSSCSLVNWLGKPIPLELEHINGNSSDNRLENLTMLCPNCHAQTPTYRGKNIKVKKHGTLDC